MQEGERTPCPSNRPDDWDRQPQVRRAFGALSPVARIERSENPGPHIHAGDAAPGFRSRSTRATGCPTADLLRFTPTAFSTPGLRDAVLPRSEEHTSELQSQFHLVCRLLLEKKKKI